MQKSFDYITNSFKNPFEDINANKINDNRILNLWCTPFDDNLISNINEERFRTQPLPIILQGFRGSGKTMILRYFSYPVQKERAKCNRSSIYSQIIEEKSVGFYFVCEEAFIKTFRQIFTKTSDMWIEIFEHYFELRFCKQIITVLKDIATEKSDFEFEFFSRIDNLKNSFPIFNQVNSFDQFLNAINEEILYIDNYKNDYIFSDCEFNPNQTLDLYSLSSRIISIINSFEEFSNTMFLLLVDEFENLPEELQRFFNTAIKFSKGSISLRIGRRSEGKITTATINNAEYLRENHDYFLARIDTDNYHSHKKYFAEIAEKRLVQNAFFHDRCSISFIIGSSENLDNECINLCHGKTKHIKQILSSRKDINDSNLDSVITIISNPENPIAEALNALWVVRNKTTDPILAAKKASKAMTDFFSGIDNSDSRKYKLDYSSKYRYSITCLIASVYKKQKMYYSFNTVTFLSNGNTRSFINICRLIISNALFYERDSFLESKRVSNETQNKAICEFAYSEFNSICSIIRSGNYIRNLILNIGNVFSDFHKDKLLRYPETNQFVFNKLELSPEVRTVIDIAESWSMIIKRDKAQRISVSTDLMADIYYINRVFCPIFGISYRIRGGYNVEFSPEELEKMISTLVRMNKLSNKTTKMANPLKSDNSSNSRQLSLFEMGGNKDE